MNNSRTTNSAENTYIYIYGHNHQKLIVTIYYFFKSSNLMVNGGMEIDQNSLPLSLHYYYLILILCKTYKYIS